MVSQQQKRGYTGSGQSAQTFGELPLVGLGGVSAFVGITSQQYQVNAFD